MTLTDKDRDFARKMKAGLEQLQLKDGTHPELQEGQKVLKGLIRMADEISRS